MTFIPLLIGSGSTGYDYLERTRSTQTDRLAATPEFERRVADFKANLDSVATLDDLFADRSLLRVALGAFGLEEDIDNTGFLKQVLASDLSDSTSLANRLTDKRYLEMATAFNFDGSQARIPNSDPLPELQALWDQLSSVDDLFKPGAAPLLERSLEVFGLEDQVENTILLKQVLTADVDDQTSIVNRLSDPNFKSFALAFQNKLTQLPASFLAKFDTATATALQGTGSAKELLDNTELMNKVLRNIGLGGTDARSNRFLLENVLDSDPSDPRSFANRLGNPAFAELAAAFDFHAKSLDPISIYEFGDAFEGKLSAISDIDTFLADDALVNASLRVFGLDAKDPDTDFLRDVLTSDLDDPNSVANLEDGPNYANLARAFGFADIANGADPDTAQEAVINIVEATTSRSRPPTTPVGYLTSIDLVIPTLDFFGLPSDSDGLKRNTRLVSTDPTLPSSLFNVLSDDTYRTYYSALDIKTDTSDAGHSYPAGFASALAERYLDRQFEAQVGEQDSNMRIALTLEREFETILESNSTETSQWYSVLASAPVRSLFETVYSLPSSFGTLDVDQQVKILRDRSEQTFGTNNLTELSEPDMLDTIRDRFLNQSLLVSSGVAGTQLGTGYSAALTVLRGG